VDQELISLRRQARQLKPSVHVGRAGITDALVRQVRQALAHNILVKVRFAGANRDEIDAAAGALGERVPCRVIERKGFVAVLYAPPHSLVNVSAGSDEMQSEVK